MRYFSTAGGSITVIPGKVVATKFRASSLGLISDPSYGWAASVDPDENNGMFSEGVNQPAFTADGTRVAYFNGAVGDLTVLRDVGAGRGLNAVVGPNSLAGQTLVSAGSVGAPGLAFIGDTNTGIYSSAADKLQISTGGAFRFWVAADVVQIASAAVVDINAPITVDGDLTMGAGFALALDTSTSSTDTPLQFNGDPDSGISYVSANVWRELSGGGINVTQAVGFNFNRSVQVTKAAPSIAANQDNWNPGGNSVVTVENTAGANLDITGLSAITNGAVFIVNTSDNAAETVTLKHENASSTAANRFDGEGDVDVVIPALGGMAFLYYNTTTSRWHALLL